MIPFNETKEWYEQDGADHWFEIPLNTDEIKEQIGMEISGRVFTTRMPQNLDSQEGDFDGEIPVGATNKKLFIQKGIPPKGIRNQRYSDKGIPKPKVFGYPRVFENEKSVFAKPVRHI